MVLFLLQVQEIIFRLDILSTYQTQISFTIQINKNQYIVVFIITLFFTSIIFI